MQHSAAAGNLLIIQDADPEDEPHDYSEILDPLIEVKADGHVTQVMRSLYSGVPWKLEESLIINSSP